MCSIDSKVSKRFDFSPNSLLWLARHAKMPRCDSWSAVVKLNSANYPLKVSRHALDTVRNGGKLFCIEVRGWKYLYGPYWYLFSFFNSLANFKSSNLENASSSDVDQECRCSSISPLNYVRNAACKLSVVRVCSGHFAIYWIYSPAD